jgi:hypothetical protein
MRSANVIHPPQKCLIFFGSKSSVELLSEGGNHSGSEDDGISVADFHIANEPVFYRIYVLDHPIEKSISTKIANYLMNSNHHSAGVVHVETHRFDVRVDHAPLPRPILSHSSPAMNCATFHAVGPLHVRLHGGQGAFEVPGVKVFVQLPQNHDFGFFDNHVPMPAALRFDQELSILHDLLVVHPDVKFSAHNVNVS